MAMEIVTGFAGKEHVTASQLGRLLAGSCGMGCFVLNTQNKLAATMQTANKLRIDTGDIVMYGRHVTCESFTDLTVASGVSGQKRNDLVVCRYTRNASTGIETAAPVVIKGVSTTGTPADPAYNTGSVLSGAVVSDMPLYRLPLNGLTVGTPVRLFEYLMPAKEAWDSVAHDSGWVSAYYVAGKISVASRRIGSVVYVVGASSGYESTGLGDYRTVTQLNVGHRPDKGVISPLAIMGDTEGSNLVRIDESGNVALYSSKKASAWWSFSLSFPAA